MLGAVAAGGAKGSSQWDNITFNLSPSGNMVQFGSRRDMFPAAESRGASLSESPKLGRFLQPDPIGYGDGMNMYGYVGGDPVISPTPDRRSPPAVLGIRQPAAAIRIREVDRLPI
jgi:hypothetical protein